MACRTARRLVDALGSADVVLGSPRQLAQTGALLGGDAERLELTGPLDEALDRLDGHRSAARRIVVLASGDPGFFGIVRALRVRFGADALEVHPAPSSVSMAFARLGLNWDDALVVSAHGRPLDAALDAAAGHPKVAILTSPDNPPEAVGKALLDRFATVTDVAVVSRIGAATEEVHRLDPAGLAGGSFDPLSVVILMSRPADDPAPSTAGSESGSGSPTVAWGRAESDFEHRDGMITKAEVRAVALGKLAIPRAGVAWDLGTGSGSVAVEMAAVAPGLAVIAVDRDPDQIDRARTNAFDHGVDIEVVLGEAPAVLAALPDPDRVFIGGGGIEVLDAALRRLRPGGVIVATYAVVQRAVAAHERLGSLVQVDVSRAVPISDLGFRLVPENPIFVVWGPAAAPVDPFQPPQGAK